MDRVALQKGGKLPLDRQWAVTHDRTEERLGEADQMGWMPKSAFLRGAAGPGLQAVEGGMGNGRLILSHPEMGEIVVDPQDEDGCARLIEWLSPLWPENKSAPARLRVGTEPLTDTRKPFVSINVLESLHALEAVVGRRLGVERFRGNLWIEGSCPFDELDWIGRTISIGSTRLKIRKPIGRCAATSVDPSNGKPDMDMVQTLTETYGHANFGVYAEVIQGGNLAVGDEALLDDTEMALA